MKLLLNSFVATMGNIPDKHNVLSGLLPPLEKAERGLDIDYSLLLCAELLVFDEYSYDRLKSYRHDAIRRLWDNMRVLKDAGFLRLVDFQAKLHESRLIRRKQLDATTTDLSIWLPHLKAQVGKYDNVLKGLKHAYGDALSPWDEHTFGIATYLLAHKRKLDGKEALGLRELIDTAQPNNERVRAVLRPVVEVVQANVHLARELSCVPYCWGTLTGYYDQTLVMLARTLDSERREMRQCRRFFGQAFPQFKPRSAGDWVELLSHRKVRALRERIAKAIKDRDDIDGEFGKRSLDALAAAKGRLARFKKYSGWIAGPVAVAGGVVGGELAGIAGAVAGHVVPVLAHKGTESVARRVIMKPHDWLYFTAGLSREKIE